MPSPNVQALIDEAYEAELNSELAADAAIDAAELQAALAADAAADAEVLAAKDAEIAELEARIAELESASPPTGAPSYPIFAVNDAPTRPESSGPSVFTVLMTPASDKTATVDYTTVNGTATAGQDFTATSGTLTFAPGETAKTVTVTLLNDTLVESNEAFTLQLSKGGLVLAINDATASATITSEDTTPPVVPPSSGYPDASNTGVPPGTTLTTSTKRTFSTAGEVVSGLILNGAISITANNVTIQKCKIVGAGYHVVNFGNTTGGKVLDCEIDGKGTAEGSNAINGRGEYRRNNIHGVENGLNATGTVIFTDNYVWGLKASGSPHYDCIQLDGSNSNSLIEHNTLINDHGQTAAVMIDNYFGPQSNITVNNNRLIGGGYTVYSDGQFSGGPITGVKFTNNRLKKGYYGYKSINNNTVVWTGNVDDVTGAAIP